MTHNKSFEYARKKRAPECRIVLAAHSALCSYRRMKMIGKVISETKILIVSLIDSMEKNYASLFKGAVVLLGVSLAGLIQSYSDITKFDYGTRKIQYEVEASAGENIDKIECASMRVKKAECNLVKYQLKANKSAMRLAGFIIVACGYFGFFLMYLSVQGYICKALRQHNERT